MIKEEFNLKSMTKTVEVELVLDIIGAEDVEDMDRYIRDNIDIKFIDPDIEIDSLTVYIIED